MNKVFISSIMRGFADERGAVESAIKSLGLVPIMAEQFPAQPSSPRRACLQGVRKSDVFIAILGDRYGNEMDSGKSPCEEEFDEARKIGLPIFIFIKECERDERQEAFKDRITSYGTGYFVCFFDSVDRLFRLVTESLSQFAATTDVSMTLSQASSRLHEIIRQLQSLTVCDPALTAVIIPSDQREPYFSPMELAQAEEKEAFQKAALFGRSTVLSACRGIEAVDRREHLELRQPGARDEVYGALAIHPDGTLGYVSCLSTEEAKSFGLFDHYVIDEGRIQSTLTAFYSYASWFYERISVNKRPIFSLYTMVALFNKQGKRLGPRPVSPPQSMNVGWPGENQHNALTIPGQPLKVAYAKLLDSQNLSQELMHLIIRAHRAAGLYYEP